MNISRLINYLFIIIGGIIALYVNSEDTQNVYFLILGIFLLMLGLYRLSRGISSKTNTSESDNSDEKL
ncbi:hypothetical protein D7030_03745 [Flavobacteriaceae bacterium AU392]|nr:hypothetical protein D1817_10220 [Flavobacteriaceae bacterium]RKM85790.1 hypothetical protein D7030_03745 [Flavobacteriaceae bacterium AU392]